MNEKWVRSSDFIFGCLVVAVQSGGLKVRRFSLELGKVHRISRGGTWGPWGKRVNNILSLTTGFG